MQRTYLLLATVCALTAAFGSAPASAQSSQPITMPAALAYDTDGNLFIADAARNQVLELMLGGDVVVVAGTGVQGFGGDGGAATTALLNTPRGVAVAADGSVFIADTGNRRVRAVVKGTISTIAGSGASGDTGDGGPATAATLSKPTSLALVNGTLLVCDASNHRVRKIANGSISGFAGSGTQGFGGDGGSAVAAELDTPQGLATLADGRVLISDSHSHRIRIVGSDGTIGTFAGTGSAGFSGDGGPATAARLSQPRELTALPNGVVLVADSGNQRIRAIDTSGVISTLAGSGVQGTSNDAESAAGTSYNLPRGLAVSPYGNVMVGDAAAPTLKAIALNGNTYLLPAPVSRVSRVTIAVPASIVYGQGQATVSVAAVDEQGTVELDESGLKLKAGTLAHGTATILLSTLPAASHTLSARYSGDGLNLSASSPPVSVSVVPAPTTVKASDASVVYGQPLPQLSGTLQGILPQDAGQVAVVFSTAATASSDAGVYPITASLSGPASGNYSLSGSAAATLTIRQAKTTTTVSPGSQTTYAGLPSSLRAVVVPEFGGDASGEVDFLENGTVLARARAANGVALGTYLNPTAGEHAITATYNGNTNFAASTSGATTISVAALPDFTIQSGGTSQSVQAGLIASYVLSISPQGGPFTGSVSFSVSGLPNGAQASFSPSVVVPGSQGVTSMLSVQTPARLAAAPANHRLTWLAMVGMVCFLRRRSRAAVFGFAMALLLGSAIGCGDRVVGSPSSASQSYSLVVSATSTNLAGAVVTHTLPLTLTLQ